MPNKRPVTAAMRLEYLAAPLGGVVAFGTMWNVFYGETIYRIVKPCTTKYNFNLSGATSTTDCPAVPHVPWSLIIICIIGFLLLSIASFVTVEAAGKTAPSGPGQVPPPARPGPAARPDPRVVTTGSLPAPNTTGAGNPAREKKQLAFLGDPRFSGFVGAAGLVLTLVQLFK